MAGHSKWANIKYRKSRQDAKKGQMFTKAAKEIIVAAKIGGGDPDANPRLRMAIEFAKSINMPKDKIENAIKKGTGELTDGASLEEVIYEGYGPGGVAIYIEAVTDNRNRTVAELRRIFTKNGGSLGEAGCVSWMFEKKGMLTFDKDKYTEDQIMEIGLDAGVEDIIDEKDVWEVYTSVENFMKVKEAFEKANFEIKNAEITMVPKNFVDLDKDTALKALKLYEQLYDHDDVQKVYMNFDIPDEIYQEIKN